jgi:hypothetical protein
MQEPYVKGFTDWMSEGHEAFERVYTNYSPSTDPKYITSQPALPWHVNRTFDELNTCTRPEKKRPLSWVVGNSRELPGHMKRYAFLNSIQSEKRLDIDLFGRAVRYIEDKWDGLADYRYSIAAENTVCPDYWTEKIADCFLSWTIPFYYGCTNIEGYFPADSFIRIDIEKPQETIETINRELLANNWERRLPALEEARHRVLYEYQIFPYLVKLFNAENTPPGKRTLVVVPRYQRSLKTRLHRMTGKVEKVFLQAKGFFNGLC